MSRTSEPAREILQSEPQTFAAGPFSAYEAGSRRERLARRRCAATAVDLILLAATALLLAQARWSFAFFAVGLFLMRDWGEGYSPGKRIFRLIAFDSPDCYCTLTASVLRNVTLLPPLILVELLLLLFSRRGRRLGDMIASSTVDLRRNVCPTPAGAPADATEPDCPQAVVPTVDEMIIDESSLQRLCDLPQDETTAAPSDTTTEDDTMMQVAEPGETPAIAPDVAAQCLGISGEVTYETLDDAYWRYVERFSPDAAENLETAELLAVCAELAASKLGLPVPAPAPPPDTADRAAAVAYLNDWFVIINKCRDSLS